MFCLINRRISSEKIDLFFQEITFIIEFLGSNFLLPIFSTGGKWDFQVANLLLATVNFEPFYAPLNILTCFTGQQDTVSRKKFELGYQNIVS